MDHYLHYLLNGTQQQNQQLQTKQTTGKPIRKSRSLPYSMPENNIKRPSSPFIIWFQSERSKISNCSQEQNRNITSQLEARWKSMSKEEKAPFYYEAKKAKRRHKNKYPSNKFKPRQAMKTVHPKKAPSKILEKPKENKVERTASNNPKEDVMSRCMAELEKLMNSPSPTKQSPKEDVMRRCMAELEQLMNRPQNTKKEVCEKSKLRKEEVLRRVRDELIAKISTDQVSQHPSFMYPGYLPHTPYNSPCFPSPGYSYSSQLYG
ncbi:hypothetical protein CAEBREN_04942 [Caenorhabditis brenneri]|uniref:Sex-determining region Y protein n=1 Tax=Caenorhabditis brenneri TaxID=135651 RepID=G0PM71_CAEBE|nr:hypothetical protein CAEBREN_04942 [Caenorhabditis brenneri]